MFYAEPKTTHHFRLCVVEPYVGKDTCAILEPDKADAAEAAATAADAGPGAGAAANDSAASVPASCGPGTEGPDSAQALGGPPAAVLMARALMLVELKPEFSKSTLAEYTFHERLGGGIAGRVLRVTDGRGCVFAGKCAQPRG